MPLAWHAAAVTRPARPPPVTSTVSGCSGVTFRPPAGVFEFVRHHAVASSLPTSMPRRALASSAACSKRLRMRAVRSGLSATRLGACSWARMARTCSGMSTLFCGDPSPSASHGICGKSALSFRRTAAGPKDVACSPMTMVGDEARRDATDVTPPTYAVDAAEQQHTRAAATRGIGTRSSIFCPTTQKRGEIKISFRDSIGARVGHSRSLFSVGLHDTDARLESVRASRRFNPGGHVKIRLGPWAQRQNEE